MDLADLEGEAALALRRAGQESDEPPCILEVARRLTGRAVEVASFRALPGDGCLVRVRGEPQIYVRGQLTPQRLRWVVPHELGHLALGLDSSTRENEDAADAFAAALLLPRRAFQIALQETGVSYSKLARWFATTESCAALRFGEVTSTPLALVAPVRVRVRGEGFGWPLKLHGARIPGVKRTVLRDDRRRVAMRVG